MRVVDLWRYPVKSLQGEQLATAELDERGQGVGAMVRQPGPMAVGDEVVVV